MRPTDVSPIDPRRLEPLIGHERVATLVSTAAAVTELLGRRRLVNVNSTATGGGVAELLATLVGYAKGAGVEADWLVIDAEPEFFRVTKRIHNGLYGSPGDGGELGARERATYEAAMEANADRICAAVRAGDIVVVHDPQPAGLVPALVGNGALVVWRCHVGFDGANESTERAWDFLRPYLTDAHAYVFTRESFAPEWVDRRRLAVIPPSIDPFTTKNVELGRDDVLGLLNDGGLVASPGMRSNGRVTHPAEVVREGSAPSSDVPLVVQISRWDRMKDMQGVLEAFVDHVPGPAQLVLAGPAVAGVADDPEGAEVWAETCAAWERAPDEARARVHLAAIPMDDPVENALVVNALQRHARVVTQKSLAEGFGLTVAEAMWKSRPIVASAVGGIVDQIVDGETGLLIADPHDHERFGAAVTHLLDDPADADRLARNARSFVTKHFLADRHLLQYAELASQLLRR